MQDALNDLPMASTQLQISDAVEPWQAQDLKASGRGMINHAPTMPEKATLEALVLDARLRQSLVTVRSLGQRGLRVAALESSSNIETSSSVATFSSRWCQRKFVAPSYEQSTEPYLAYLEQLLDRTGASVLITSSDGTVELIRRHREQLERRVRIALAKDPALSIATNKEQTLEIAERLGLDIPRGVKVESVNEVPAALR